MKPCNVPKRDWSAAGILIVVLPVLLIAVSQSFQAVIRMTGNAPDVVPKMSQLIQGSLVVGISLLLLSAGLASFHKWTFREVTGWDRYPVLRAAGLGILAGLLLVPVTYGLAWLCQKLIVWRGWNPGGQEAVMALQNETSLRPKILFAFLAVGLAPLAEELLFRGMLLSALVTLWSQRAALLMQAVLFGLIHGNAPSLIPLMLVGWVFGLLFLRTGSLLTSLVAHVTFNMVPFVCMILGFDFDV